MPASIRANESRFSADAVVVGGGTVGAWCAYFLRQAGLDAGRPAGEGHPRPGREQPGGRRRPDAGRDTRGGTAGPVVPPVLPGPARGDRHRLRVHRAGLPAALLHRGGRRGRARADGDADRARRAGALARARTRSTGSTRRWRPGRPSAAPSAPRTGYLTPPRNVAAYTVALIRSGVEVREHDAFRGGGHGRGDRRPRRRGRDEPGPIDAGLVVLTGGPKLAEVGRLAGCASRPAGPGTRSR